MAVADRKPNKIMLLQAYQFFSRKSPTSSQLGHLAVALRRDLRCVDVKKDACHCEKLQGRSGQMDRFY